MKTTPSQLRRELTYEIEALLASANRELSRAAELTRLLNSPHGRHANDKIHNASAETFVALEAVVLA